MAGIMQCPSGLETGRGCADRPNRYGATRCHDGGRKQIGPMTEHEERSAFNWNKWLLLLDVEELETYKDLHLANWDKNIQGSRAGAEEFLDGFRYEETHKFMCEKMYELKG